MAAFVTLRRPRPAGAGASRAPAPDEGMPLFRLGFRPFFLAAALFGASVIPLWVLVWSSHIALPADTIPTNWHAHEMVFGFTGAVIAGFLLTAVRNWTSQPTPVGVPLAALVAVWVLGRVGMFLDGLVPYPLVALVDVAFFPAVAIAIARPIARARNWRNLAFVPLLLALAGADLVFHFVPTWSLRVTRAALDLVLVIVAIVGGRVVPSFTESALSITVQRRPWVDRAAIAATLVLAGATVALDRAPAVGVVAIAAGLLHAARLVGWRGWLARRRPILWILHLGYAWLAVGLLLRGAATFFPTWMPSAATHALSVGAVALLVLGMMSRVSLGHTGRLIVVSPPTVAAYALLGAAALVRALGPLVVPTWYAPELWTAAVLWSLAFVVFTFVYAPILWSARVDGKPG